MINKYIDKSYHFFLVLVLILLVSLLLLFSSLSEKLILVSGYSFLTPLFPLILLFLLFLSAFLTAGANRFLIN